MCQNIFTGRIVQTLLKSLFCLPFFYYNLKIRLSLSEKTFFLSIFDFLGLRDPHFQEIRYFVFVRTLGFFSLSNSENLLKARKSIVVVVRRLLQDVCSA